MAFANGSVLGLSQGNTTLNVPLRSERSAKPALERLPPLAELLNSEAFQKGLGNGVAGQRFREELSLLVRERDARVLTHSLFIFAESLQDQDRLAPAVELLSALADQAQVPDSLRSRARRQSEAIQGVGSTGDRLAFLLPRLGDQGLSLPNLAAMVAAGGIGRLAYAGLFSKLAGASGALSLGGKLGVQTLAGLGALAFEAPVFAALNHGAHRLLAPDAIHPGFSDKEIWSAAIFLGAMKGSFFLGNQALKLGASKEALQGVTRLAQGAFPYATAFTGIVAARKIEQGLGLQQTRDRETLFADALASLWTFVAAGSIVDRATGPGYRGRLLELEARAEAGFGRPGPFALLFPTLDNLAWAGAGTAFGELPEVQGPSVMLMAALKGRSGGSAKKAQGKTSGTKKRPSPWGERERLTRKEYLFESETLDGYREVMRRAQSDISLVPVNLLNSLRDPGIRELAWMERLDALVRLEKDNKARRTLRYFQANPGMDPAKQREDLKIYLDNILEAARQQRGAAALAASQTEKIPESSPASAQKTPVPPRPELSREIPVLMRELEEKARKLGVWKVPELMAIKLWQRIQGLPPSANRDAGEYIFREALLMVRGGEVGAPDLVKVFEYSELVLQDKLDQATFLKVLDGAAEGGFKGMAAVLGSEGRSLAGTLLDPSIHPLPGKTLSSYGIVGMVEYVRRYNILAHYLSDAEIKTMIQSRAAKYSEKMGGLQLGYFHEVILSEKPSDRQTLAKAWNVTPASVTSTVAQWRKDFNLFLKAEFEAVMNEKMRQAKQ